MPPAPSAISDFGFRISDFPSTLWTISDFGFGISDLGFPARLRSRRRVRISDFGFDCGFCAGRRATQSAAKKTAQGEHRSLCSADLEPETLFDTELHSGFEWRVPVPEDL